MKAEYIPVTALTVALVALSTLIALGHNTMLTELLAGIVAVILGLNGYDLHRARK
jgi:branched-subunit amino acid transport protein